MRWPKRWKVKLLNLDHSEQIVYPKYIGASLVSWDLTRKWEYININLHACELTAKEV
jgi:hypothetical protein